MKIFISIIFIILVLFAVFAGLTYFFRYDILEYSAESVIMKNLPEYIRLDSIVFDAGNRTLEVIGFCVLNPAGYGQSYFCRVGKFKCRYEMKGQKLLDGIVVTEITAEDPVLHIERKADGRINLNELQDMLARSPGGAKLNFMPDKGSGQNIIKVPDAGEEAAKKSVTEGNFITRKLSDAFSNFNIFDFLELSDTLNVKNGRFVFTDGMVKDGYEVSLESILGDIRVISEDSYRKIISIESRGSGIVNGYGDQKAEWITSLDPGAKDLTMANNFKLYNVDLLQFKPYFDRYLPIDVLNARGSGEFVINFDNGNIGSTDTLNLKDLRFRDKTDDSSVVYWQGAFNQVLRYLTSSTGEVTFDFKIKGPMENPAFYPGPYVKRAVQSMVVDKIAQAVESVSGNLDSKEEPVSAAAGSQVPQKEKTDVEKVVDIISVLLEDK